MAEKDSPTQEKGSNENSSHEVIDTNDSEKKVNDSDVSEEKEGDEEEENFIEDEEIEDKKDEYKPKTAKRIKSLISKLKAKDIELQKYQEALNEYKEDEEEIRKTSYDEEDEIDEDKPLTVREARKIIERESKIERMNQDIKEVLISLGYKTAPERQKFGKGLDKIAVNIQEYNPSLSFKQAIKKAYEIKYEGGERKRETPDTPVGGTQRSMEKTGKNLSADIRAFARMGGVKDETIKKYNK